MISTIADIVDLLELEPSQFIPEAYESIIGRAPDVKGVINYAQRLDGGLPRLVMLSELYSSREGQAQRASLSFSELDKIFERCFFIRNLPIGKMRWWLLPRISIKSLSDPSFDWLLWAGHYIEESFVSKNPCKLEIDKEDVQAKLIQNLEKKVADLASMFDSMQHINVNSTKDKMSNFSDNDQQIQSEITNHMPVSWAARQALFNLNSILSR